MTKGELLEILKRYPNDSIIFIGLNPAKPIVKVLWSPQTVLHPTKIYLRPEK